MQLTDSDTIAIKEALAHISGIVTNHPNEHPRDKVLAKIRSAETILRDVSINDRVSKAKNP